MAAPKRPTFLTVLCILSFIGCGFGIFSGISGYFTNKAAAKAGMGAEVSQQINTAMDEAMANSEMSESERAMAEKLTSAFSSEGLNFDNLATSSLVVGIMSIVCLAGVFLMWQLKRMGFFIYVVGQVVSVAAPFIWSSGLGAFGDLFAMLGAIFPVIFILLYALNLKHMR
jgi:hypothetical protein